MDKLSKYLLPALYIGVIGVMIACVTLVVSGVKNYLVERPVYNFSIDDVFTSDVFPVSKTENTNIIRPYVDESVKIGSSFYDISSDEKSQESSIIYYEGTYMQNNGVDYVSDEDFDVLAVYDGEIIGIEDNDIYGKIITIQHNENLKTIYSNVNNVLVNVGYKVTQGEIIATSRPSMLDNNNKSMLHFEIYHKNVAMNPETLYTLAVSDLD